ncbi:MAG: LamG-like jellyroll fold domain-containing protein [Marmoricola sp.]
MQLANAASSSDPMLPRNAVTFQQSDRWGTSSAASFSGSGYATDVSATTTGTLGLLQSTFSFGVWFETTDSQGGGLLSLSGSASNGSGAANTAIWIDSGGRVQARAVATLGTLSLASTNAYRDGSWHLAVLTLSGSVVTTATLYVDGQVAASASGLGLLTSTTGYWHLGWASGLSAPYLQGSLSGAFVQRGALDGSTINTLWKSASASAYQATLAAQSPASTWMLADDGVATVPASTTLPSTMSDPCGKVLVTFTSDSGLSLVPASLASLVGTSSGLGSLGPGSTQVLSIKATAGSGYTSDIAGLHLLVPLTFTYTVPGSTTWTQTFTFPAAATQVFWA